MLIIPAILTSFRSKVDRTMTVIFESNELTPEQLIEISKANQNAGFLAFNIDAFKTEQLQIIAETKADYEDKTKTPSKRQRDVLFVAWKQHNEGFDNFELYYQFKINKYIEFVKSKLEPR